MTTGSAGRSPSPGTAREQLLDLSLPAAPSSVPFARALAEERARAHVSRVCLDVVRQALTEVMSHAIRAGRRRAKINVSVSVGDAVYVEVACPKARFARRGRRPDDLGLFIVGALADRWGIENGSTTRIWFSVPRWPDG
jgi:hypothetical protein